MLFFSCFIPLELLGQIVLYDALYCQWLGDDFAHNCSRNSRVNYEIEHF